jgi:hypothetical protein
MYERVQTRDGGDQARDPVAVGEVLGEVRGVGSVGGTPGRRHAAALARAQPHPAARHQVRALKIDTISHHFYIREKER